MDYTFHIASPSTGLICTGRHHGPHLCGEASLVKFMVRAVQDAAEQIANYGFISRRPVKVID